MNKTHPAEKTGEGTAPCIDNYESQRNAQVETLIDWFIDRRGCSRLVAGGYALQAVKMRYDEISESL